MVVNVGGNFDVDVIIDGNHEPINDVECDNFFVIAVVVDLWRRTQLQASTIESNSNSIKSTIVGYFHLNMNQN